MKKYILPLLVLFALTLILAVPGFSAMEFDKVNSAITAGSETDIDNLGPFTWSLWMKAIDYPKNNLGYLIVKGDNANVLKLVSYQNTTNPPSLNIFSLGAGGSNSFFTPSSSVVLNQWTHICIVRRTNQGQDCPDVYINGTSVLITTSSALGTGFIDDAAFNLQIGDRAQDSLRTFYGYLSDVAIWNVALTKTEVEQLSSSGTKNMPLQVRPNSLVRYFPLDDIPYGVSASTGTRVREISPKNLYRSQNTVAFTSNTVKGYAEESISYP